MFFTSNVPAKLSAQQQARLKDWLYQWQLDRRLRRQVEQDASPVGQEQHLAHKQAFAGLITQFSKEPQPAVGQIRLLAPSLVPADSSPAFVAVLRQTATGEYLVAPFSRFQTPAVPQEILLRKSPPAMTVLCLWNARPVSSFVLSQSWLASELSTDELADAITVCRSMGSQEYFPKEIADRVGPPVYDLADERFDYMDAAGELWSEITSFPDKETE